MTRSFTSSAGSSSIPSENTKPASKASLPPSAPAGFRESASANPFSPTRFPHKLRSPPHFNPLVTTKSAMALTFPTNLEFFFPTLSLETSAFKTETQLSLTPSPPGPEKQHSNGFIRNSHDLFARESLNPSSDSSHENDSHRSRCPRPCSVLCRPPQRKTRWPGRDQRVCIHPVTKNL